MVLATVFLKRSSGGALGLPRSPDIVHEVEPHPVCRQRRVDAMGGFRERFDKPVSFRAFLWAISGPSCRNGFMAWKRIDTCGWRRVSALAVNL
jgi:hypothetical protein